MDGKLDGKTGQKETLLGNFLAGVADWLNERVWLKVLLQALPILWTTVIIQIFKTTFYKADGNLNLLGGLIAGILSAISIGLLLLTGEQAKRDKAAKEKYDGEIQSYLGEIELRKTITEAESTLEERRNRQLRSWIEKNKPGQVLDLVAGARNPKERINTALDALSECFSQVSDISKSNIYFSAAIAIVNTNSKKPANWEWIANPPMEGTATLRTLMEKETAFRKVANGLPYFYSNNKIEAEKAHDYFFDKRDNSFGGEGSIICFELDEQIERFKVRLIISISTYGVRIVKPELEPSEEQVKAVYEDRIRDIILKQFEGEIKEDLLWYGIQNMDFSKIG